MNPLLEFHHIHYNLGSMITGAELYNVVEAMAPLYFALVLGYGSVKWWSMFTADQGEGINKLVNYFTIPLFTLQFTIHFDPLHMNYRFIGADVVSKLIIIMVVALWAKYHSKGSCDWAITSVSLCTLTNSLIVGEPLARAMYGKEAADLVVQSSIFQAVVWLTILLFAFELRRANDESGRREAQKKSFVQVMSVVLLKLARNPNCYSCIFGIVWVFVSKRWHFEMPSIVEGSLLIMSRAGTGTAMFSMGIFMALQENLIACGTSLTAMGMVLKFIAGPAAMAIGSIIVGLRGDVLCIAIIQAALPQSITSFIFANEYGLHADVLSTAVIFGMLVSVPVLVGYYAALEMVH